MEPQFWHDIWTERKIGFHRSDIHPMLQNHWHSLGCEGLDVLVPLSGKTLDMRWLASEGHQVTGIELDQRAVDEFFEEWQCQPAVDARVDGLADHHSGNIHLLVGDFFGFQPEARFEAFYDRAALIAMPEAMRPDYLRKLASLVVEGGVGMLITFEYPDGEMDGPPFPVRRPELDAQNWFRVEQLERQEVIGYYTHLQEAGVTSLVETAYRLERTAEPAA
ncbi:thiopurine S-methyltransferase [Halovibrio salipaludis]|uniref:Thiopurine S-methyltransferase n=1 Tax=Halovibrio salipaludis TaxID=2032626 RepID=A0A2A2FCA1_9GAMM|nr:thiopurine S-methyltransferase [Halovibrio salipaludis]PAU82205.1 thiopurine S-methyltransferase [Halovibrio salipaludis]